MVNPKHVGIGLFTILFSLGLIGIGGFAFFDHYQKTNNVHSVDATVLSSEVDMTYDADQNRVYRPNVTYEYTYNGETYTSKSLFLRNNEISSSSRARGIVSDYSAGDETTAYVHPDDPDDAYLRDGGVPWVGGLLPIAFGGFLLLLGTKKTWTSLRGDVEVQQS
jgi:hypothetical protein